MPHTYSESTRARSNQAPPARKLAANRQAASSAGSRRFESCRTIRKISARVTSEAANDSSRSGTNPAPPISFATSAAA